MDRIKIELGNITEFEGDAIVNAANEELEVGSGVDGAIHAAAGPGLSDECATLGGCPTGEARITGGYNLKARHIIHTVGPIWDGGFQNEAEMLGNCYRNSLQLARDNNISTIAFPAISTGAYNFPQDQAARIAIDTVIEFLVINELPLEVTFICFESDSLAHYQIKIRSET